MPKSPKVDSYIAAAQPFARPILLQLRALFHRACPEIDETIKWGMPFFDYKGVVGGMAGFKKHATWGLWKAKLLKLPSGVRKAPFMNAGAMTDLSQLPSDKAMLDLIKQAVALNEKGVNIAREKKPPRPVPRTPAALAAALRQNAGAGATFKRLPPSHKREYIEWILGAKQEQTRRRRIAQAVQNLSGGKSLNWKYEKR